MKSDSFERRMANEDNLFEANMSEGGHQPSEDEQNWWELRMTGGCPERRAYHSSFVYKKRLYIFGGKDIGEGLTDTLWKLDCG